ncbi:MAG: MBL fold metallo-hydrolase [Bryobacteraceae bacterium]
MNSDHFDGIHFFNPGAPQAFGFGAVLRWKLSSRPTPWITPPPQPPTVPAPAVDGSVCRVTLVNHSTVLIQHAGQNILTDPVWSERISPVSWAGPRRKAPPGVRFEDLPHISTVLLSHNHYDHLDLPTLRRLHARHAPRFIVPLGVAALLQRNGMKVDAELDWWQSTGPITCMPARHFSARSLTDRNRTLWCSYWIETPAGPIYFAADTGFGPHFAEIRARFGSPRLALLPIGAYKPEWFMSPVHISPAQAVEAHLILQPQRSLAIHWGTFQLADDGADEPRQDLLHALAKHPTVPPFEALPNGGTLHLGPSILS